MTFRGGRLATLAHLTKRFLGDLKPGGPPPADEAWAEGHLLPGEVALWRRMSDADRRHAVGVARRTVELLDYDPERAVVAAALLHDVGKIEAGIGPWRRAVAKVVAGVVGAPRVAAGSGRFARYLDHARIGSSLLRAAGSDQLTSTWAAEHHLRVSEWTLPGHIARALKVADNA